MGQINDNIDETKEEVQIQKDLKDKENDRDLQQ